MAKAKVYVKMHVCVYVCVSALASALCCRCVLCCPSKPVVASLQKSCTLYLFEMFALALKFKNFNLKNFSVFDTKLFDKVLG